tara:strand:+ start:740 stop:1729 length:990 start_codon:yes stop_codon:yes gene_type:complete
LNKNKFLIIGSNSFSGSSFVNFLLDKNYLVVGISRSKEKKYLNCYNKNKNIKNYKFYNLDINYDLDKIISVIKKFKPSHIINYSAQGMVNESWNNPDHWYETNIVSMTKLVQKISKLNFIKIFLNFSTPEVYGSIKKIMKENTNFNPTTPYAISRAAFDTHLNNLYKFHNFPVIITRTANVYGPYQDIFRIIPKTIINILKNKKIEIHGSGSTERSFIHIKDVNIALYKILKKKNVGNNYHISTNEFVSIKTLCKLIKKKMNKANLKFKYTKDRIGKDFAYKLDSSKLRKKLKWKNDFNLIKGLEDTIEWYIKNFENLKKLKSEYVHKK